VTNGKYRKRWRYERRNEMKKILFIVLLLISFIGVSNAEDILIDNWEDTNKTGANTINLCWVAVASNMLAYGGWTDDAQVTFDLLSTLVENTYNYPIKAIQVFSEYDPSLDVDVYFHEYHSDSDIDKSVETIEKYLNEGRAVSVLIVDSLSTSWWHYYSVWGVDTDEDGYVGLYFTDSNDGIVSLEYDTLSRAYWEKIKCNVWVLGGRYYMIDVDTLEPRPGSPDPEPPDDDDDNDSSSKGCFLSILTTYKIHWKGGEN
jgi:hypothetical protein